MIKRGIMLSICVSLCFCGCSFPFAGKGQPVTTYVLLDSPQVSADVSPARDERLLVSETSAGGLIESRRILFSETRNTLGYYRYSSWAEPPPKRFAALLLSRIERAGLYRSVSRQSGLTVGDLLLNTEMSEFVHIVQQPPGMVRVAVTAELIDRRQRVIISRQHFYREIPCADYNAASAALAFSQAVNEICDEIVDWLKKG